MKVEKLLKRLLLGMVLLASNFVVAMDGAGGQDPARNMRYADAFDQTAIYKKFKKHLTAIGCDANLFYQQKEQSEQQARQAASAKPASDLKHGAESTESDSLVGNLPQQSKVLVDTKVQQEYEKACLAQLDSARNYAISKPARDNLTMIGIVMGGAIATSYLLPKDSMGGSFSIFSAISHSVYLLKDIIRAGYDLAYPPEHALNSLEKLFAINKCYIPKALWAKIEKEFTNARQNQFTQLKAMDFLEFAVGLTTFKPKPELALNQTKLRQISHVLHGKIDGFFKDYEYRSDATVADGSAGALAASSKDVKLAGENRSVTDFCWCIKINTDKFIHRLVNNKNPAPRYIYLFGPGGIGKTHFIQKLCGWIEELIPGSVRFENMVISSPTELEGNGERPGAMLRVLRNQLMSNKHASIVFMDEATWLNDGAMVNPAKRVFNGDLSKLSTNFFGEGVEGTGINLNVPPMFVFCAGNETIKDGPLASRFDMPHYPMPKQSALVAHALEVARKSITLEQEGIQVDAQAQADLTQWVKTEKIDNFRRAASDVELYLLQQHAKAIAAKAAKIASLPDVASPGDKKAQRDS